MNVAAILRHKGRAVTTARPNTTLLQVADKLATKRIGAILIVGTQGGPAVQTTFAVSGLTSDGNVFDPQSPFNWNNVAQPTMALWRTTSGGDQHSKQCTPVFVNAATGNFRLDPSDTCAKSAGVSIATITSWDIDGVTRSAANPSIGASETASRTPATPTNVRIIIP